MSLHRSRSYLFYIILMTFFHATILALLDECLSVCVCPTVGLPSRVAFSNASHVTLFLNNTICPFLIFDAILQLINDLDTIWPHERQCDRKALLFLNLREVIINVYYGCAVVSTSRRMDAEAIKALASHVNNLIYIAVDIITLCIVDLYKLQTNIGN